MRRRRATPLSISASASTPRMARYSASLEASSETMTREKLRDTSAASSSRCRPLVWRCSVRPRARNKSATWNTSGRRRGSPPENSTSRVPRSGRATASVRISSSVKSSAPLAFHQSQDTHRLLQRLVGKKMTTGRTNVRFVSSPTRTSVLTSVTLMLRAAQ